MDGQRSDPRRRWSVVGLVLPCLTVLGGALSCNAIVGNHDITYVDDAPDEPRDTKRDAGPDVETPPDDESTFSSGGTTSGEGTSGTGGESSSGTSSGAGGESSSGTSSGTGSSSGSTSSSGG